MKRKAIGIVALAVMTALLLLPLSVPAMAKHQKPCVDANPMIFVHGFSGSGAQFESQAMRFTSNGYPAASIAVHEYDSTLTINTMADIWAGLDALIAEMLAKTGAEKVDLLGHSMGTSVLHGYLAFPDRAAKVAHYVNIDGRTALALPGGVPTLAIWAGIGTPGREIVGATNVTIPNQTHVEVATSAESFVEMFKFFTGEEPATSKILPEPCGRIELAGRAVLFPLNAGVEGATVEIWRVSSKTGARMHKKPRATYAIGADGSWGPFKAKAGRSYEFVILREGLSPHHFYCQPFLRSDYLVRLNTSAPGGLGDYMDSGDNHSNLVIIRNKELWGDQGANNDALTINGTNIANAALCPIAKRVISIFVFDKNADGVSDLSTPDPFLETLPFLTGADLFIPGAEPPDGKTSVVLTPRGGEGMTQVINLPNWASSQHRISLMFNDFNQEINDWFDYIKAWLEYVRSRCRGRW